MFWSSEVLLEMTVALILFCTFSIYFVYIAFVLLFFFSSRVKSILFVGFICLSNIGWAPVSNHALTDMLCASTYKSRHRLALNCFFFFLPLSFNYFIKMKFAVQKDGVGSFTLKREVSSEYKSPSLCWEFGAKHLGKTELHIAWKLAFLQFFLLFEILQRNFRWSVQHLLNLWESNDLQFLSINE